MRKTLFPIILILTVFVQGCCSNNYIHVTPQMKLDDFLFRAKMYTQWYDLWHLAKSEEVIDEGRFPNPGGWNIIFSVLVAEGEYWNRYAETDVNKPECLGRTISHLHETQNQVKADLEECRSKGLPEESVGSLTNQGHLPVNSLPASD